MIKTDDGGATRRSILPGLVGPVAADPNRSGVVYAGVVSSGEPMHRVNWNHVMAWATMFATHMGEPVGAR